ncbi:MAG: hypothetical protein M3N13_03600 [Candidatus Eremiobacteraeota bacterium]|nr:hypothetical protein [Candidatus Eremiobacteraeota bacterium]
MYTFTAQSIRSAGGTFTPTPPMLTVSVTAGSTATATFSYIYSPNITSFSTQTMILLAQTLASNIARYAQDVRTGTTYCNIFVRDFVSNLTGANPPELGGRVVDQLAAISTSPRWKEITNRSNWNATYADAASRAKSGQIVVVATTYQDAHIAVVMPYNVVTGFGGYQVPVIAEATIRNRSTYCSAFGRNGIDSAAPLSCGFFGPQQTYLRFFVYSP